MVSPLRLGWGGEYALMRRRNTSPSLIPATRPAPRDVLATTPTAAPGVRLA